MKYKHYKNVDDTELDLNGASILVTGATGSFGRQFIRAILSKYELKRLVVYSRDELKQYEMQQEISVSEFPAMRYFIGDVRDADRLEMAMRNIDFVIHAAALKHVPAAEYNPFECIRTNVLGAENIVNSAMRVGVKKVIALSTDKAASPANLYGASKLASDKIFIAANHLSGADGPKYSVVRYGNVVGSRGSVVPYFLQLIRNGATTLPITDYRMTRFWITLEQSIEFVLTSLHHMYGSEIFVPKIPSMKITDLAAALGPKLKLQEIGIRPGEKLHEMMITEDDARTTIDAGDRYVIQPAFKEWSADNTPWEGMPMVNENFRYTSDTNTDWLDAKGLMDILGAND